MLYIQLLFTNFGKFIGDIINIFIGSHSWGQFFAVYKIQPKTFGLWLNFGVTLKIYKKSNFDWNQLELEK